MALRPFVTRSLAKPVATIIPAYPSCRTLSRDEAGDEKHRVVSMPYPPNGVVRPEDAGARNHEIGEKRVQGVMELPARREI